MESWGWVSLGALGTLATTLGGVIAKLMRERHLIKTEQAATDDAREEKRDKTALDQWKELHHERQEQIDRLEKHVEAMSEELADLMMAEADCQLQLERIYGTAERMHADLTRCCTALKVEPPTSLPPRTARNIHRREFRVRQLAQDTATLAAVTKEIKEQQPPEAKP